jgi:ferredoxin
VRVVVDKGKCLGNALCVAAAPEVFDVDDEEGLVVLLQEDPGPELADRVARAVKSCPTSALSIEP